ncbi:hypothetical protein GYMLUDRAFT_999860 [Collybiopsis luxurians FD-317 M1]|uniref:Uncharacterized protein n=1 Tax=Collybiopsis luxurians FD-317 M1 TaxID=944289 RepID=A0A0D0CN38_9AGAR|nr:hypothetical protein GYMLUDRAFT_999860 [Collybiopsis luxurians FD-317 M1]
MPLSPPPPPFLQPVLLTALPAASHPTLLIRLLLRFLTSDSRTRTCSMNVRFNWLLQRSIRNPGRSKGSLIPSRAGNAASCVSRPWKGNPRNGRPRVGEIIIIIDADTARKSFRFSGERDGRRSWRSFKTRVSCSSYPKP